MGLLFEDLIRRFNEAANETAGDHFTPREVIRLMVNVLLEPDEHILTTEGIITTFTATRASCRAERRSFAVPAVHDRPF